MSHDFTHYLEDPALLAKDFESGAFTAFYQPQYDHATGMIIGAEALARHIEDGKITPPCDFIPLFEESGLISALDLHIWTCACAFLRRMCDAGAHLVPISVNFSRHDIGRKDIVDRMEAIRKRFDIPVRYLHIEITESSTIGGVENVRGFIQALQMLGYTVEIDDFGSGYSSLNMLKDLTADRIKLDMGFLSGPIGDRGGTIISSVVRMAMWLGMTVIAEGVETVEQADFMRSIGCNYVQGYLYAKPICEADFAALLTASGIGHVVPQLDLIERFNAGNFWDPRSRETLIFNNFVGGAAIFEYDSTGHVEVLRVNRKYLEEMGMNMTERDIIKGDAWAPFDDDNRRVYTDMLDRAIASGSEEECETLRTIRSACCGTDQLYLRANVRLIGKSSDGRYLFYAQIRNITAERRRVDAFFDDERRFKMASEQINIYYWEYTVATREMRPCFRCMRDLGLPPLVKNYPEPAIEMGIFPLEVADMYREWHRRIAAGERHLEAVMPLTPKRIPYRVRYTTAFDENGYPVKAYGSASPVDIAAGSDSL